MREAKDAKPGEKVMPDPSWNRSEQHYNQLRAPTTVLGRSIGGQTGILLEVETKGGRRCWLSSAWFTHIVE